jgi:hypothetical protein
VLCSTVGRLSDQPAGPAHVRRLKELMTAMSILILASGLMFAAISVPLIRRKIPMNRFYGFRVRAAFASQKRWYAINEYSGRVLARWAFLPILTGVVGLFLPEKSFVVYSSAAAFLLVCSAVIPTVLTLRWIRRTS